MRHMNVILEKSVATLLFREILTVGISEESVCSISIYDFMILDTVLETLIVSIKVRNVEEGFAF
jgi:hypothetical protein